MGGDVEVLHSCQLAFLELRSQSWGRAHGVDLWGEGRHRCQEAWVELHRPHCGGTEGEDLEQERHKYQMAWDGCMDHQSGKTVEGRQGVLVVDVGEELEREVVVVAGRQVQGDDLLAVELVKEIQRLEELGRGAVRGEGVRGRNRCTLQHKSEPAGSDQGCAQDCDPKQAPGGSVEVLYAESGRG